MKLSFFLFLVLFLRTVWLHADDWPRFLGPTGDNVSKEKDLLASWPSAGLKPLWARSIGAGYAAPSVAGNQLVLAHRSNDEEIVECMTADSGQTLWRRSYPSHFVDPYGYNNGPRSTPLLTSNRCYSFGAEGYLLCSDLKSGRELWHRNTGSDWEVPPAFFGVGSSPVLESNRLFVMVGGQPNSGVVALDPDTGKTLWESIGEKNWTGQPMRGWPGEPLVQWRNYEKQASYATPVLATIHGQRHLLCFMRQGLVSVNPENGNPNFSFWFRSRVNDSVNAMSPIVQDDLILLSAAYYKVGSVMLKVAPSGREATELWRNTSLEVHWNRPVYRDGFLYAFSGRNEPDARFRCVEFRSGAVQWDSDQSWVPHSSPTPGVFGRGSAILADGKLIALGEGGLLGLFEPSPKAFKEISRFQVPGLHYPCWTAPVLADKRLYLRSEDRLVCFSLRRSQGD